MRILITNDDGINAPGLEVMERIASEVAGPDGEVWTVAPAFEQSGVAHAISYTHPTMIAELAPRRWVAEGSPADCVLAAVGDIMAGALPDLVLSGVNRGNNAGENVLYSGTIGGAMEAALKGLPAIALSQYFGPGNAALDDPFEAAATHGAALVRDLLAAGASPEGPYRTFYNVNFPPVAASAVLGRRVVAQGARAGGGMQTEPHLSPSGRRFLWVKSGRQDVPAGADSDVTAALERYIAVTPMRCDLTAHDLIAPLAERLT